MKEPKKVYVLGKKNGYNFVFWRCNERKDSWVPASKGFVHKSELIDYLKQCYKLIGTEVEKL